jgi:homoserine/homoserine lactone efflux protein
MSLQTWLLFCATEAALCVMPGPAVLTVISQSLSRGAAAGLAASVGILAANAAYFALSGTGIAAVLLASSTGYVLVKWLGAAYLVVVGARMIFERRSEDHSSPTMTASAGHATRSAFSIGLLTQGVNPKALVFFTAILPQFINPAAPLWPQILILGVSSVIIEFVVLTIYIATCHTARAWIGQRRFARPLHRLGGVLLIAAGARLAVSWPGTIPER